MGILQTKVTSKITWQKAKSLPNASLFGPRSSGGTGPSVWDVQEGSILDDSYFLAPLSSLGAMGPAL